MTAINNNVTFEEIQGSNTPYMKVSFSWDEAINYNAGIFANDLVRAWEKLNIRKITEFRTSDQNPEGPQTIYCFTTKEKARTLWKWITHHHRQLVLQLS